MPAIKTLISALDTGVENITKRGNNIPVTGLERTLKRFGIKDQEIEASGILKIANKIAAERNKVSRQGNLVITPEDLKEAVAKRTDVFKEATTKLDPKSITDEEGFFIEPPAAVAPNPDHIEQRWGVIESESSKVRNNLPFRMLPEEAYDNRLEILEDYVENAELYGFTKEQTEASEKQLEDFKKFLEDPSSVDRNAGISESIDEETLPRLQKVMDEYDFAETSLKDEDFDSWNKRIEEIVEEDLVDSEIIVSLDIEEQHLALGEESLFATIAPHDLDKETYRVTLYEHPALSGKYPEHVESKYFSDIEQERDILESFHVRAHQITDTVFGGEVAEVIFEIQSSSRTNYAWALQNIAYRDLHPRHFDPERLEKLEPDVSVWKNAVYQELARAQEKGIKEVQFLIEPGALDGMGWTKRVQESYKKILPNVVMNAARKIDAKIAWKGGLEPRIKRKQGTGELVEGAPIRKSRYLVVGLPAAAFTLPLYAEENKEESFMATAKSLGLSEEEAREYLEERIVDDLEKLEDTKPTNKLNREGRVEGGRIIKVWGGLLKKFLDILAQTIFKNSQVPIPFEDAQYAAKNIIDRLDSNNNLTNNPDYAEYIKAETESLLREKHDLSLEELEEMAAWKNNDWEKFSRDRGYTEEEIKNYKRTLDLQDKIVREEGLERDLMDEVHVITDSLDEIGARPEGAIGGIEREEPRKKGSQPRQGFQGEDKDLSATDYQSLLSDDYNRPFRAGATTDELGRLTGGGEFPIGDLNIDEGAAMNRAVGRGSRASASREYIKGPEGEVKWPSEKKRKRGRPKGSRNKVPSRASLLRERGQLITSKNFKFDKPYSDERLYRKQIPAGSTKFKQAFIKAWADDEPTFKFEGNTYSTSIENPTPEIDVD